MSTEKIVIQIDEKIAPSINLKLTKIAGGARAASSAVDDLAASLAKISSTGGLDKLQAVLAKTATAQALLESETRLTQSAMIDLSASVTAAAAAQRHLIGITAQVATAQTQGQVAAHSLATAQQQTVTAATAAQTAQHGLATATAQAATAQTQSLTAAQQLATAQTHGLTAAQGLAAATTRVATAQTQGQTAAQHLATSQQAAATALINQTTAANNAAASAIRLSRAQAQAQAKPPASMGNLAGKSAGVIAGAAAAVNVLQLADTYTVLQNKLQNVATSQAQVNELTDRLFGIATRSKAGIEATVSSFVRFDLALKGMGKSQEESLKLTETITKALAVGGATAEESASSLLQLSQAFNRGKLSGDEFASVMENMPADATNAISKQLGVTRGELQKLSEEGKITPQVMLDAFNNLSSDMDSKIGKTIPTLSSSMVELKNSSIKSFGEINKQLGITSGISKFILMLAANMDVLAVAAAAVGTAMLIAFGPVLINSIRSAVGWLLAFNGAILLNPFALLAIGLAAATTAFIVFSDKIKVTEDGAVSLKDAFVTSFDYIKDLAKFTFGSVADDSKTASDKMKENIKGVTEESKAASIDYAADFKRLTNFILAVITTTFISVIELWNDFPAIFKDIFNSAANFAMKALEDLINGAVDLLKGLVDKASGIFPGISSALKSSLDGMKIDIPELSVGSTAKKASDKIKDIFAGEFAKDFFVEVPTQFKERSAALKNGSEDKSLLRPEDPAAALSKLAPPAATIKQQAGSGGEGKGSGGSIDREGTIARINAGLADQARLLAQVGSAKSVANTMANIENALSEDGIKLSAHEAAAITEKLKAIESATSANAIRDMNKDLAEQSRLLSMTGDVLEVETQLQKYKNDADSAGYELSQKNTDEIKKNLEELQNKKSIMAELNSIHDTTIGKQAELNASYIAATAANDAGAISADNYAARLANIAYEQSSLSASLADATFADTLNSGLLSVVEGYQGILPSLTESFGTFFQSFSDGFADSIGRAIVYSEDLGQSMRNLSQEILSGLISSLVKLGIQYSITALIGKTVSAASIAATTAASVAAAASVASAWAGPAALTSLASFGGNSAPAIAGMGAAAGVAAAIAVPKFREGGYTGDMPKDAVAGMVHGQEFVMDAGATSRIGVDNLRALQSGAAGVQRNAAQAGTASAGGGAGSAGSATAPAPAPVVNTTIQAVVVQSREAAMAAIRSAEGEAFVLETIEKNGMTVASIIGAR